MITITKEQIEMYASAADATQTFEMDKGKLICVEPEHMLELARIALASLEAEPVAYVMADDLKDSSIISTPAYRDLGEAMERTVGDVVALYAIHPRPASLDAGDKLSNFIASQELLGKDFEKVLAENIEELYVPGNTAPPAPVSVPAATDMCSAKNEELITITLSRIFEIWHKAGIVNATHLRQTNIETMASSILFALSHPDKQLDESGPFNIG